MNQSDQALLGRLTEALILAIPTRAQRRSEIIEMAVARELRDYPDRDEWEVRLQMTRAYDARHE